MAEGSETPNGEGIAPEGRARREADLFAERRARRAAESGEAALTRRAEAAEATVQTLERHVASLQQRLSEAEDDRRRVAELVAAERAEAIERENELRRVKQREYAEQQLRVEAEDRLLHADRESRVEIERLSERLGDSEHDARELTLRLDALQRQLAEAEHAAEADRVAMRSVAELNLQERILELERWALEIQRGLDAERIARERSERQLESIREGHRRMESLLGEMRGILARVSAAPATDAERAPAITQPTAPLPVETRDVEMADALAAAVERLRARAEATPAPAEGVAAPAAAGETQAGSQEISEQSPAGASVVHAAERERPGPAVQGGTADELVKPTHKHSMSWFARRRMRRKLRRERRAQ